jgi:two-component system cell cycle sensor histidine kinase/response regulator CckA
MMTRRNGKRLKEGKTERLVDEGSLPGNGALFKTIFEKAALGIVVTDLNGRILQSNPFFQQLLGYPSEEIIQRDSQEFTHPDDVANERSLFLRAMEDGQDTVQLKKRYVHKDGHAIWADLRATICRGAAGEPDFVISAVEDITDKLGISEALRKNEEPYRVLAEAAHDMIFVLNREEKVDYVNSFAIQQLALLPEEILGRSIAELFPGDAEHQYGSIRQVFEAGQPLYVENPVQFPNQKIWLGTWLVPIKDEAGQVKSILGVSRDITKDKRAEDALRESEERYRRLVETAPDVIYSLSEDGTITTLNPAFEKITGWSPDECLGKPFMPFVHPDDLPRAIETFQQVLRGEAPASYELRILSKSGEYLVGEFVSTPQIRDGKVIGELGIARNITERKRAEVAMKYEKALLDALMDNIPDSIYFKDRECRMVRINRRMLQSLKMDEMNQALGKTDVDLFGEEFGQKTLASDQHLMTSGEPIVGLVESRQLGDGQINWTSTTKVPLRDNSGQVVGLVGITREMNEFMKVQADRERERNLLRTLIDNLPDLVFFKDVGGHYVLNNRAHLQSMNVEHQEDVLGKTTFDFHPHELAQQYHHDEMQIIQTGKALLGKEELAFHRNPDEQRWHLTSKIPVKDSQGKVTGIIGISRDITEHKRAEEAIQQERNLLRTVIDNLPDVIYVKDVACRKTAANRADLRNMGCQSEAEALGKTDFDLYPREVAEAFYADDQSVIQSGQPVINREEFLFDADGQKHWLLTTKVPLRDQKGQIIGLVGIGRDITNRVQATEELRESQQMLQTVLDTIPVRVFWKDRESRYLGCNSPFARDAGFNKPEELVGKNDFQFSWRDQASLYVADDLQVITAGLPKLNYEEKQTVADGHCAWVLTSKIPLLNAKGEITGVLGTYEDITERKRTEEALHHERNLLRTLIDNLPDGIYVKDADCRKTVVNQADLRNMGCQSEADALGKTDFSLYPPEIAKAFYADDLSVLETGQAVVNREEFFFDPEGRKRWLLTSKLPLRDQNGRIVGLVGIGHDITERRQTEEALTKLSSAVEQAVDGVIITTKAGIIEYVNPAWEEMTAFSKEDTVGKTPRILKSGKQGDSFYRAMWKTISDGEVWKGSLINKKKSGELFHAEVSIAPIIDESHNITHFVAIERDVTEHRQLEQQLIQALRMEGLGTLAGGVAHDFNNLLGIILGHATLLEGRRQDPTKFSRSVDAISTAVQRGAGLVRQLLTFARKTEAVLELVNANETVEELVQMLRETFPRTVEFSLDLSPDLPSIPADRNQLYQALLNLCVNSRDAMPTVGTISIRTDTIHRSKLQAKHANAIEEKYIHVMVSDTGKGMDEATRSRIFEPFFTTKERGKGTGLGLSVVYGVVDSHSGFIDVESEVGHGTTFNLYFPILPLRVEPSLPHQQESSQIVGGREAVLVVEDEEMLLESVTQVLEAKGYQVLTAADGTEGLEIYSRHRDDVAVVLMDMGLPKLGGWEVFQKMKAVNPRVKVVLASGYLDPYIKSEMLKAGAKDFIQKPYVPEQILTRVRRVIDGK